MQRSQRDTQRRNDLARVATGITQYQTNNNGKLPYYGKTDPVDGGNKIADICKGAVSTTTATPNNPECFIKNYMNGVNATENEFMDPDGWSYGLTIQDFKDFKGIKDFDHMVYIVHHAGCDGETVVTSKNARDYAITYKLEGNGTYCADNGS